MPWGSPWFYPFTEASVILNAADGSGVYALHGTHVLHGAQTYIFLGETKNIRAQLIQHLRANDPCMALFRDLTFSYELVAPVALSLRWAELVREFRPVCNERWA